VIIKRVIIKAIIIISRVIIKAIIIISSNSLLVFSGKRALQLEVKHRKRWYRGKMRQTMVQN